LNCGIGCTASQVLRALAVVGSAQHTSLCTTCWCVSIVLCLLMCVHCCASNTSLYATRARLGAQISMPASSLR
jgi:hypothetical protein